MRRPRWPARIRPRPAVLYVCIPAYNEAATVGVLLWRLRTVLAATGRDYEVVVHDDGSTDGTADVLAPYRRVLPLTLLGGPGTPRLGRSGATEALVRHVAAQARYPRRDACVFVQADFTDRPEDLPALLAAFDAGADLVVGRRPPDEAQPPAERRLRRMGPWVLRPLVRVEGVDDLLTGYRLLRAAVLRDLVRARGAAPILDGGGWAGVAELLVAAVPFARRVETVDTPGRYDVRPRASRLDWAAELRALARAAWRARGTHARPNAAPPRPESGARPQRPAAALPGADPAATQSPAAAARPERPRRADRTQRRAPEQPPAAPRPAAAADHAGNGASPDGSGTPSRTKRVGSTAPGADRQPPRPEPGAPARSAPALRAPAADDQGSRTAPPAAVAPAASPGRPEPTAAAAADRAGDADVFDAAAATTAERDELAAPEPAAAPRRKKRRSRRRSRGGASAETADAAGTSDVELSDGPGDADDERERGEAADLAVDHDAGGAAGDSDADDTASLDAGRGRRRKRRRSRSGKRTSGVPAEQPFDAPSADAALGAPPDADGRPDAPSLDRSSTPA